MLTKLD